MLTKLGLIAALLGAFTLFHGASASAFEGRGFHHDSIGWRGHAHGSFGRHDGRGHRGFRYGRAHFGWHRR